MSSFKQPPPTSFEDLTLEAKSDLQHHSANPSNQGSSFASIGNLQSLNSIEDSLLGNFDQHLLANPSNRGSSFSSIGNLQSLNLVEDSLPENFDKLIFLCICTLFLIRQANQGHLSEENDAQYLPISSSTSEVHGHDGHPVYLRYYGQEKHDRLLHLL
ncbi:hypothetical protein LOK49_LG05G01512 [Camellia lanceoleosa]|uniref:Uncharacterized protein n=1 Tax=Camellia lanceoleosa TaxID=1840588 RepID=A0ACC0HHS5_9ERIC|nr:hypothetical protein LOK49_LG05G01512 [Camellia lanceoleosa]